MKLRKTFISIIALMILLFNLTVAVATPGDAGPINPPEDRMQSIIIVEQ